MSALAAHQLELAGPYVTLDQLLALRHVPLTSMRRNVLAHSTRGGSRESRHRGRGVDFAEVRLYQPGDDVRSIDWRVTARRARPHTKVFREERERPALIIIDQSQSMFFGSVRRLKSVLAAEAGALLAWHALEIGERVGGIVIANRQEYVFKPRRSNRAVVRLLGRVARCNAELDRNSNAEPGQLLAALRHATQVARRGYRLFLISDVAEFDEAHRRLLVKLARFNEFTLVLTIDPLERELPLANRYAITDGHERAVLFSGDQALRRRYRNRHDDHVEQIRGCARQAGFLLLTLETGDPVAQRIAEHAGI
ncbi:MAG: DUF58 domain-containing protein [Gammaproteobacteria bacterium]|nr:MAG: DUF58 domain-containing protein [Gammaproteobacteria bacterium]TDJ39649.1 MAG: DUF58 domain-containing protein [Gammaproteobacteria bacterium]